MTELVNVLSVSAIVSVYKAERFILGCLEDLISQTLFQQGLLEIVIINSNSPENEEPIIRSFQQRYPDQILYIRTPQRETIYQAWNRGIQASHGRYITNANADDRHRHDALEIMADILDADPGCALVYADSFVTGEPDAGFTQAAIIGRFAWPAFDRRHLFQICYIGPQPMWRRDLHNRYGYFNPGYRSAGDYDFWLRLAAAGERFVHSPEPLGLYLRNPEGIENSNSWLSALESQQAREVNWPAAWGRRPAVSSTSYLEWFNTAEPPLSEPMPLVSVIIPTCNRPDFLAQALQSVLNQTYLNYEIIVVNDGGCDVEELIHYLNRFKNRIRYLNLPVSVERSAARNCALRQARGRYIAYLDDDDQYYPEHLETLVGFLEKSNFQVAYSDARCAVQEKQGHLYQTVLCDVQYSHDFDRNELLVSNYIPILCIMHDRACLAEVGYFDETLTCHEDWELWLRMSEKYPFVHVQKITCEYSYRLDGSTTTSGARPKFLHSYQQIVQKYGLLSDRFPELLSKQRSILMGLKKNVYEFLGTKAAELPSWQDRHIIADDTIAMLKKTGATLQQIKSACCMHTGQSLMPTDPESAATYLWQAVAHDPDNVLALEELVRLASRIGNWPDAAKALNKLWCMLPDNPDLGAMLHNVRQVISMGRSGLESQHAGLSCSIIIPVFNRLDMTQPCLEAVKRWTSPGQYELIVVDNASTDGTADYLAACTDVHVLTNQTNLGFAKACNQGAAAAKTDLLLFLNNDTVVHEGWLAQLLTCAAEHPDAGVVGCRLLYPDGTVQYAGVGITVDGVGEHLFAGFPAEYPAVLESRKMQAVTAACMLVKRTCFDAVGGFDEQFINGYEDVDFCLRAREKGFGVQYCPHTRIIHYEESSPGRNAHEAENKRVFVERWAHRIAPDYQNYYESAGLIRFIGCYDADEMFLRYGHKKGALLMYLQIIERFPDAAGAYLNIARILLHYRQPADAHLFAEKAIRLAPDWVQAHQVLAQCQHAAA